MGVRTNPFNAVSLSAVGSARVGSVGGLMTMSRVSTQRWIAIQRRRAPTKGEQIATSTRNGVAPPSAPRTAFHPAVRCCRAGEASRISSLPNRTDGYAVGCAGADIGEQEPDVLLVALR